MHPSRTALQSAPAHEPSTESAPAPELSQEPATSTCLSTTLIPVLEGRRRRKKQSFPKHLAGISCPVALSGVSSSVVPYTLCPKEMFCLYAALLLLIHIIAVSKPGIS